MQAAASLSALSDPPPTDATLPEPFVFINGIPHPTATVTELTISYPLDQREARVALTPTRIAPDDPATHHLAPTPDVFPAINAAAAAILARPVPLVGGSQAWQVLAAGHLQPDQQAKGADTARSTFLLVDRFSDALASTPPAERRQRLEAATDLHTALRELAEHAGLAVNTETVANRELAQPLNTDQPLGDIFQQVLEPYRLHLRLRRSMQAGRLAESLTVLPDRFAPQHRIANDARTVMAFSAQHPEPAPTRLTAQGPARRTESTFALQPGYPDDLLSEPDTAYSPDTSPDWPTYSPVFRRWILNEDHADTTTPTFDLAEFFNNPQITPTPLRFGDCLTLDTSSNRLPPQLETSYDNGATFTLSTLSFELDPGRAALTLTDPTLPAALFTAARNGQLRVRLTASLTAPTPTRLTRFQRNPFLNPNRTATHRHDDLRFDTLHPDSIHAARVATDQLQADTQDDTRQLRERLIAALDLQEDAGTSATSSIRFATSGLAHTPGDRLQHNGSTHCIQQTHIRFDLDQTDLTLASG